MQEFFSHSLVINVSQFAPVGKSFLVTSDPLDSLLLEQPMIFPGGLLDIAQIEDRLMPRLTQNGDGQVLL